MGGDEGGAGHSADECRQKCAGGSSFQQSGKERRLGEDDDQQSGRDAAGCPGEQDRGNRQQRDAGKRRNGYDAEGGQRDATQTYDEREDDCGNRVAES